MLPKCEVEASTTWRQRYVGQLHGRAEWAMRVLFAAGVEICPDGPITSETDLPLFRPILPCFGAT